MDNPMTMDDNSWNWGGKGTHMGDCPLWTAQRSSTRLVGSLLATLESIRMIVY